MMTKNSPTWVNRRADIVSAAIEVFDQQIHYYQSLVPASKLHVFGHSSHASYLEETHEYVRIVRGFLSKME